MNCINLIFDNFTVLWEKAQTKLNSFKFIGNSDFIYKVYKFILIFSKTVWQDNNNNKN